MKKLFLLPGQIVTSTTPVEVSTNLGSCVSVILFDQENCVAGLNHYLLPSPKPEEAPSNRFGSIAIDALVDELISKGADRSNLQAKVYGGGNVLQGLSLGKDIGDRNVSIAIKLLSRMKIQIVEKNVGGKKPRKIIFRTDTYDVQHITQGSQKGGDSEFDPSGYAKVHAPKSISVLIVDDNRGIRTFFEKLFVKHGLKVAGSAEDAFEARKLLVEKKPSVITLDIDMPKMSGVNFLKKLMKHMPTPVVMVSQMDRYGEEAMEALEAGAIEFIQKPTRFDSLALRQMGSMLVEKVRAAASAQDMGHVGRRTITALPTYKNPTEQEVMNNDIKLIAIGGNTGCPESLEKLIKNFPEGIPPVVVSVSTITHFLESFVEKLRKRSNIELVIAKDKQILESGSVYFIPGQYHATVADSALGLLLKLQMGAAEANQIPSANVLFKSAASAVGCRALAILLSGFGSDGIEGLGRMRSCGAISFVQAPEEAQFPFTPQHAIAFGLADFVLPIKEIGDFIKHLKSLRAA